MKYTKELESLKANLFLLGENNYVVVLNEMQKQNKKMYEALKLAKKIIHSQMGKGLVLTNKDYNKMFDPIKEIEQ